MANVMMVLIFTGIGYIFGPMGAFIGFIIGLVALFNSDSTGKSDSPSAPVGNGLLPPPVLKPFTETSPTATQQTSYADLVVEVYAHLLSFFPNKDQSRVQEVSEVLLADDWIPDRHKTFTDIAKRIPVIRAELAESPMLFQLQAHALNEKASKLPAPMKSRLLGQLGTLSELRDLEDPNGCQGFLDRLKAALAMPLTTSSVRSNAESLILQSGDRGAISTLNAMKRDPSRYKQLLKSGAQGNVVLKTALGVMAGVLLADVVKAAMVNHQLEALAAQVDQFVADEGGLDQVPLDALDHEPLEDFSPMSESESSPQPFQVAGDEVALEEFDEPIASAAPSDTTAEDLDIRPTPVEPAVMSEPEPEESSDAWSFSSDSD